ncbi:MAG: aminopeptidase [Bacteroidaceae bacterium]|nr:aminopeptidase [Bacteroidaceae bacterium]
MKKIFSFVVLLLAAGTATASELTDKLSQISAIKKIDTLQTSRFKEKYVVQFSHPVDYKDSLAGTFAQRVFVCHRDFSRPTVLVTEGYGAAHAMNKDYCEEIADLLNLNLIVCEYRYFLESTPQPCNYDYLTVWNSLCDYHEVITAMKRIYTRKWLATGISKGGQTTMFYRAYFPDDVDVSVPYVAPLNKAVEDGRHEPFVANTTGTKEGRKNVLDYQLGMFKRKSSMLPIFEEKCRKSGYTFRLPVTKVYDYWILEFAFAYWQWGEDLAKFPSIKTATDREIVDYMYKFNDPSYFQSETYFKSFNVQAVRELGYYGYDITPFRKYMAESSTKDYLRRLMLPEALQDIEFSDELYNHTVQFLQTQDPRMIYIYGEWDPWSATGVCQWLDTSKKQNLKIYVQKGGSHKARISTMPDDKKAEIIATLKSWLE